MKRVLILAHDFPPLNSIGGRRPFSWYQHFPKWDIHPVVITKSWEEASATVQEIAGQQGASEIIQEETPERTIIRIPLKKSLPEKLLARYGDSKLKLIRRMLTFFLRMFSYVFAVSDKNVILYRAAKNYIQHQKVDVIIATGEPFILFKHAHLLSRKFNIPWIADFRDGWYLNHVTAQQGGLAHTILWQWEYLFEKRFISSCKFITSVDPLLSQRLGTLHKKQAFVIYNGFEELVPRDTPAPITELPLLLCHAGTLYPGHRAEALLQAVAELHVAGKITPAELKIQFVGVEFYPEQYNRVMNYSSHTTPYLETTRRLPRMQALNLIRNADFLVTFTDLWTPVLPTKMYEYVAAQQPVLVILNDHSILAALINELRAGVVIDSVADLKIFLLQKIEAKKLHQPLFNEKLDVAKAMEYSRETQSKRLAMLLQNSL